jgi:hypothetical protein
MQQQTNNMQMQPQQPMQDMGQGGNMQPQQPMQDMAQGGNMQPRIKLESTSNQPNDAHLMEEGGQVVDEVTDNRLILNWGVVYTFFK